MSAQIIPFPGSNRRRWSANDERGFEHLVRGGMASGEAAVSIDAVIADQRASELLPEKDRLLYLARQALRRATPVLQRRDEAGESSDRMDELFARFVARMERLDEADGLPGDLA